MRGAPLSPFSFITVVIPKRFLFLALGLGVLALAAWSGWESRYPAPTPYHAAQTTTALPSTTQSPQSQTVAIGQPAPDFSLPDLGGNRLSLSSFRGQPVVVYFWATWCHYCLDSMADLQAARALHKELGLEILAINILESAERVRAHARRHGLTLPILLDLEALATQSYLVRATPTYYLIDHDGVLRDIAVGALDPQTLNDRLKSILPPPQEETS